MPTYNPPLRDMQFVMHEVLNVAEDFKQFPQHADVDVDTINAVLEEGGKFAAEVAFPINISGDTTGNSPGGTGVYFNNNTESGELVSKTKAIAYSIIFG